MQPNLHINFSREPVDVFKTSSRNAPETRTKERHFTVFTSPHFSEPLFGKRQAFISTLFFFLFSRVSLFAMFTVTNIYPGNTMMIGVQLQREYSKLGW